VIGWLVQILFLYPNVWLNDTKSHGGLVVGTDLNCIFQGVRIITQVMDVVYFRLDDLYASQLGTPC
jgi:hypothetical protein